ncbi:hypothetical protein HCN44_010249 [Aphidius gifuensis]|uniref:Gustatory receptor n=1 Tax=Aphidius gifuensis TaxID=684658 RepID=A0A834XYT2_APHGI|nr:hypothetical protein HCN44_010249 [Aphidius gifuensis]
MNMNNYLRNNRVQPLIGQQPLLIPLFSSNDINSKQQRKLRKNDESFHNIIKPIITVSQFFGNFPINGIQHSKPDEYVFEFTSLITCYSLMIITLIGCNFILMLFGIIKAIHFTEDYQFFFGIFFSILRTIATFTWVFCDLLIILVSIGLAERYKQLNEIVRYKITNSLTGRINWRKIKEKYAIMNELVKETDDIVSPLILLSCTMNVYMICVQTSEGIRSATTETKISIYHCLSLLSIVLRTMAVVLSTARIDDESGHALSIFARCHPSVFIIEVR